MARACAQLQDRLALSTNIHGPSVVHGRCGTRVNVARHTLIDQEPTTDGERSL
jgi:hypothetical protein